MATVYNSFASQNLTAGNTVVISKPSGVVDGDALIAIIAYNDIGGTTISSVPSGWTAVTSAASGGSVLTAAIAVYKKIASSEGSNYTWGISNNRVCGGTIIRFTQNNQTDPVDVATSSGSAPVPTSNFITSGVTPTVNNGMALGFFIVAGTAVPTAASSQAIANNNPTWTEIIDDAESSGADHFLFNVAYALRPETTATGNYTATVNANFIRQAGGILFIKRIEGQTFTETVTMNETVTNNIGYNLTVLDAVTPTEVIDTEKQKNWSTQNKSSTSWANQDKL